MTETIIEADVEQAALGRLEGLGWSVAIRPNPLPGELRTEKWNADKRSTDGEAIENKP